MAMPYGPRSRASRRACFAVIGLSASIAIAGCSTPADVQRAKQKQYERREQDELAGYMVRLGYDRWVAACAYATARGGGSQHDALTNCTVDFQKSVERARAK